MGKIIGIDLGTTNSCVAVMEGGSPKVIHSSEGRNVIPSVVDPISHVVGDIAKRQLILKPKKTVYSVKRLMGRKFDDPSVQQDKKLLSYEIKSGRDGMSVVGVEGKTFTPQELSAMILQKIKKTLKVILDLLLLKQLLQSQLILMIVSVKQQSKQEKLLDLKFYVLLMNQLLLP